MCVYKVSDFLRDNCILSTECIFFILQPLFFIPAHRTGFVGPMMHSIRETNH